MQARLGLVISCWDNFLNLSFSFTYKKDVGLRSIWTKIYWKPGRNLPFQTVYSDSNTAHMSFLSFETFHLKVPFQSCFYLRVNAWPIFFLPNLVTENVNITLYNMQYLLSFFLKKKNVLSKLNVRTWAWEYNLWTVGFQLFVISCLFSSNSLFYCDVLFKC